jgi:hypothetical protein
MLEQNGTIKKCRIGIRLQSVKPNDLDASIKQKRLNKENTGNIIILIG